MSKICIIPARGGSKRIPQKNIKLFLGHSIISYSIKAALSSGLFDEVMVSTDDVEIAEIAKKNGAIVPFLRSKEKSDDYTIIMDVITEVMGEYEKQNTYWKEFCCLFATAPFVDARLLIESYNSFKKKELDCLFPVVKYDLPIQRALKIENEKTSMIWPEYFKSRSQDLCSAYYDAALFYWADTKKVLSKKNLWTDNAGSIVLSNDYVQDIDTMKDWAIAEKKFGNQKKHK